MIIALVLLKNKKAMEVIEEKLKKENKYIIKLIMLEILHINILTIGNIDN